MRQGGDIFDRLDNKPRRLQGRNGAFSTSAWSLYLDFYLFDPHFDGLFGRLLSRHLSGVRGTLAASLETARSRTRPAQRLTLQVGNSDHRVVEGCLDVDDGLGDVPSDFFSLWTDLSHFPKPRSLFRPL